MDQRILDNAKDSIMLTNWRIHMNIPSVLALGETFALRMTAFGPDDLPCGSFDREIVFDGSIGIEGLPRSVRFSESAGGHLYIDDLRAAGPDNAYVRAMPEGSSDHLYSNPAWVFENPPYRIYWGDIHVHTTYSNCSAWQCKDPEFCYAYARDASYLDFAAAADHLRGIASDANRWPRLQELACTYHEPGTFVTFLAFESSHKTGFGGDINAYFLEDDAPYFWLDRDDMKRAGPHIPLQALWDFLDASGKTYCTVPHHTARAGKYRDFSDPVYDPEKEPVFEIYSGWGSSECRTNRFPLYAGNSTHPSYFQDALVQGCRYGVIASSDDHTTMVGAQTRAHYPFGIKRLAGYMHRGLTAIRAPELTRKALWDALTARNCYGTTFSRTLLDVAIGDLAMGQEGGITGNDPIWKEREIKIRILSTDFNKTDVVLLRNCKEIDRAVWDIEHDTVIFRDHEALDEIAIRDAQFHPDPFVVYYVRVENQFNQTQWTSPIWLDLK